MKITRFIKGRMYTFKCARARWTVRRQFDGTVEEITRADWADSLRNPTAFYIKCCHYFDHRLPAEFRAHRAYFTRNNRSFGEDAFHAMWFLLFREFRPAAFLEIGVYRGQSLSLASLLACHFKLDCSVQGISPFSSATDSVSYYRDRVEYQADTLKNFAHFSLPEPALLKAFSADEAARQLIAARSWPMIYIDGNHDYEVARQDWLVCSENVPPGGVIVLDDAGLTTPYQPPGFATGGHPGPSRLAQEIDRQHFCEILQVGHNRVFQKIVR